jgi:acetyl esterase/lipase
MDKTVRARLTNAGAGRIGGLADEEINTDIGSLDLIFSSARTLPQQMGGTSRLRQLLAGRWPIRHTSWVSSEVHFEQVAALLPQTQGERIAYGADAALQFGMLRIPSGPGPHPVAMVIHGGCWQSKYDCHHVEAMAARLTKEGIATWVIEYRRLGNAGGGWPGTFLDVASALDHLRHLTVSHRLDIKRVITIGHSAGGHLALWLAARTRITQGSDLNLAKPLPLSGVISLAGISDIAVYSRGKGECNAAVQTLMGGSPEAVPHRYAQGNPRELLPTEVPHCFIHGSNDAIVPVLQSQRFVREARKSYVAVTLDVIEGAGHFDVIAPFTPAWATVESRALSLLFPGKFPHRDEAEQD